MDYRQVRQERTGWRDLSLSQRHRKWGYDCPAVDLDFPMLEYNAGRPSALIEYKAITAKRPDIFSLTYRAIRILANNSSIPFFVVFYDSTQWWFRLIPANRFAIPFVPNECIMTEREYVSLLCRIRNQPIPSNLISGLNNLKPKGKGNTE